MTGTKKKVQILEENGKDPPFPWQAVWIVCRVLVRNQDKKPLWRKLTPHITVMKPMSDLCWVCQRSNGAL